jgi:hypothetical protein
LMLLRILFQGNHDGGDPFCLCLNDNSAGAGVNVRKINLVLRFSSGAAV